MALPWKRLKLVRPECDQTSSTNISGLFDFLPSSVKTLKIDGCTQQYIGKEVFYGIPHLETLEVFIGITSGMCEDIDLSYNNVETLDMSSMQILGIGGKTVNVDLSHNNMTVVYVTDYYAPYKELVDCSHRSLSSIPDDISNVTTILHLEGNQLTVINQTVLPQLLMIRELYLNDNNISYVGDMSFNNFISLEILRLDGNNISQINSQGFKFLSNLQELYLNHSGLRYLAANTFQDLVKLQKLHLENNKLKSVPENLFSGLKKLTLLGIHGNPLTCGCDVLWFANWLRSRAYLLSQGRNVSCVASTKVTRDILSLSAAQFDCDDLQAAQARTRLIIGLSLPLVLVTIILVCVIVIVKRKEDIQVYLYARYGWSQHDLDVVLQDVLPALENREPPFRVCLHHRDFLPGVPIAENILNAVSASKRTIILLSNNFLESDWCQLEFQAAHAQMLQDRANRVIVILLDDIPAENAPADIQHYLKTNTYLKWGDERFWERLIYAMPRPRPHAQNEDGDQLAMVELDHNG
ncbi:TIR domain [Branchiostoma belcheri]|nr:TIR domain [Branchiostoma belcheri]